MVSLEEFGERYLSMVTGPLTRENYNNYGLKVCSVSFPCSLAVAVWPVWKIYSLAILFVLFMGFVSAVSLFG